MNDLHREGFQNVTSINDATRILLESVGTPRPKLETIKVSECVGRVLGEDIASRIFVPPLDRSVMDGYAVCVEDVRSASRENPAILKVVGESRLGEICRSRLKHGQAVAVATGSMVPQGADAVVKVEQTAIVQGGQVAIHAPAAPGQHISKKGEDVSPGMVVLRRGRRLRPQDLGVLRELGDARVRVAKRPRIAVLSTGNELIDSVTKQHLGKATDLNRPILSAMLRELGAQPVDLGLARDREDEIVRKLKVGLRTCEAVLVTAGSSVGKKDLVPKCINALGSPGMLVHGVAMRPSLPTGLALVKGKVILSLPGFPVSAIIAFRVFARPLIAKLLATEEPVEPIVKAVLKERIGGPPSYRTFVRVLLRRTEHGMIAEPLKLQRSSVLMSMVTANGIVTIPEEVASYEAGQLVDVTVIGEIAT